MTDKFGRTVNYLRLSVTDKCNLRCFYCMPMRGIESLPHADVLRFEEISRIARLLVEGAGINKVRLTGGEPLIRRNVIELIRQLHAIDGIEELVLTTNALTLAPMAGELKDAGISRVNVSLDTLKADRFRDICRGGDIEPVFEGIRAARDAGMEPLKINVLLLKGVNEDEVNDFIRYAGDNALEVRFIEFMRVGHSVEHWSENYIGAHDVAGRVEKEFELEPLPAGRTTVRLYSIKGTGGRVGFISGASGDLCEKCNRIRLTSDGKLRPCLMSETSLDARQMLRAGASDGEIVSAVRELISKKGLPDHYEAQRDMFRIGG